MTQDCLDSPSTADVSKRLPKGIHVIGAERLSDPSVEGIPRRKRIKKKEDPSTEPTSWSYLFIFHMAAKVEGTKRSVYLRERPKMMEEPRIEMVR